MLQPSQRKLVRTSGSRPRPRSAGRRAAPGWTFDFGADHEDEEVDKIVVKDNAGAGILVC